MIEIIHNTLLQVYKYYMLLVPLELMRAYLKSEIKFDVIDNTRVECHCTRPTGKYVTEKRTGQKVVIDWDEWNGIIIWFIIAC